MVARKRRDHDRRGQAAIELALVMPFIMWLIYYTLNAFYAMHTAHIAQRYSAMSLWERVDNRSKYVVDDVDNRLHNREFMAVQYMDDSGKAPERKILNIGLPMVNIIGICREPVGTCRPQ